MQAFMIEEATAPLEISVSVTRRKCKEMKWHLSNVPVRIPPQVLGLLEGATTIKLQWFLPPTWLLGVFG